MERSSRPRYLLFGLASIALAAMGVWVALRGSGSAPGEPATAKSPAAAGLSAEEHRGLRQRATELREAGEDVHGGELVPPPGVKAAGRRFLAFYLPYEVGRINPTIAAGLRATSTPGFADQLLREAPRVPPGVGRAPPQADFLAVDAIALGDQPGGAQIVAKLWRGGDLEAAAFELRRFAGTWLVSGVAG